MIKKSVYEIVAQIHQKTRFDITRQLRYRDWREHGFSWIWEG